MNRFGRAASLLCLCLPAGCYRYVQTDLATVPEGAHVRVFLTRRGLVDIPPEIPVGSTFVSGVFGRQTSDSILIRVPVSRSVEGQGALDLSQNVYVPLSEVVSVDRREFSGSKTALALGGGTALIAAAVAGLSNAGGADAETGGAALSP